MSALDPAAPPAAAERQPVPRPRAARWRARLERGVSRLMLVALAGLVLAGIVHIVTILLIPLLSEQDAASAYMALGGNGQAELIAAPATSLVNLREADPATVTAVCSYDLGAGPVRVVARAGALPLGLTLHRRGGGVLYAITDRAAIRGVLEFVVMTEEQLDQRLARDEDGEAVRELRVISSTQQGLIVARVLTRRPSDRMEAEALATGVACGLAD